jgi:hypothetical protein
MLKGEEPTDLPEEVPTKYEPAINRKTGRSIGARAEAVIV